MREFGSLQFGESLDVLEGRIHVEALVFFRAYTHYAIKRAFFFSILRCDHFFNVAFKIKGLREAIAYRWGNGINYTYPLVSTLFSLFHKEIFRHPFVRNLKLRPDRFSLVSKGSIFYNNNSWSSTTAGAYLSGRPEVLFIWK